MCGIAGIYGLESVDQPIEVVESMVSAMQHRGPDSSGIYQGDNVVLGHARLSIIDLDAKANQPFTSLDGRYTIVFNGEIYNYQSLRSQLPEYDFVTNSDTEVLLAALIKWGMPALQKANGMFAFALYDRAEQKLWLARDRMGIKPLYVHINQSTISFASEIRSLLKSGLVPRKLNRSVLQEYLQYQCVHDPETLIENVHMVEAGTYYEVSDTGVGIVEYWKPWQNPHFDQDPIRIKKNVRDLLASSIDRRLVSDVPIGAFLSGGIDSSMLVGIASERLGKRIDTFNVSFKEEEFSEAAFARRVAARYKTNHHEISLDTKEFMVDLPEAVRSIDHPSGDGPNSWIVSRETKRQGITVALSGLGGDEVFGGYDVFKRIPQIADQAWSLSFPKFLRRVVGGVAKYKYPGIRGRKLDEIITADYFDLETLYPIFRKVLLRSEVKSLIGHELTTNAVRQKILRLEEFHGFSDLPTLSRISIAEFDTYMRNVLLRDADQMSMAQALEIRVPFLDHELVEYCMHISDQVKFPHTPKKLLIDSYPEILPDEVVNREKMGFVLPWEIWMKNDLSEFCQEGLNYLCDTNCMSSSGIQNLWNRFKAGDKSITWSRVWPLVVLGQWLKINEIEA